MSAPNDFKRGDKAAMGGRGPMGGGHGPMGAPVQKAKNFKASLSRLITLLRPYRGALAAVFILTIAGTIFSIASPKLMGQALDKVKDSFMARTVLGRMSGAQDTALKAIAGMPGASATTNRFLGLPLLSSVDDPKQKAAIVREMADIFAALPPETTAGMKLTPEQLDDAIRAIEVTGGKIDYSGIGFVLLSMLGLYLISALCSFATQWIMSTVSQRTVYRLRRDVDEKLGRLPLKYFDTRSHGEILSRMTNDVDTISNTLQQSLTQALSSIVQIVGFIVMMLSISGSLTLIVLATLPLYIAVTVGIAKRSQKYFKSQQEELGALSGHVEEMYSGHEVVSAYGRERKSVAEFDEVNARLAESGRKAQFVSGIMYPAMSFISNVGYVLICVAGGVWITKGRLTIGDISAFIQYSRSFSQPIIQTANIANIIQSTVACAERVFELLDETEELPDQVGSTAAAVQGHIEGHTEAGEGSVSITNMSFRYKLEEPLIENLDLDVEPGHTIAIVGPTGAGKTTLVNLLMRFYEIDSGSILVDGRDLRTMPRAELRSKFGMVLQDTWLFNGTIRDNIAYGKPGASEDDIVRAAVAAHADHFIRTLPQGYDTILNEEAGNISQGQKQLLTIARAILADPEILILDEATSSVDTRTEVIIRKAMENLMRDRTSFVIAHRLSTVRDAELILVMDKGSIVERGTHTELLAKCGFYAELYKAQFAGGIETETVCA
ncbi:MAG: ABC transporter ATP-binding protein [Rectinemataceae bacterium]